MALPGDATPAGTGVRIRRYAVGVDAPAVAQVFFRSVREVATRHYSESQVRAWAPRPPHPSWFDEQVGDGRVALVAVHDVGGVVGFGDLQLHRHIDHLFCDPDVAGTGVGSQLYRELERHARGAATAQLSVDASETARGLFERHGFRVERRQEVDRGGVLLHNYRMVKDLGDHPAGPG